MARKTAPGTLVHCDTCGEDYSSTYKRCPFCGKNADKYATASYSAIKDEIPEDDYVFDGGDLFDDLDGPAEPLPRPRSGGKRLEQNGASAPISWPRLITFLCAIVIIIAALVIVFAYIYPRIHDPSATRDPDSIVSDEPSDTVSDGPGSESSGAPSDPVISDPAGDSTEDPSGDVSEPPGGASEEPSTEPSSSHEQSATGITLDKVDFTLQANASWTIKATVSPATWSGTVTWTSSDTSLAVVDQNGKVTNVNSGSYLLPVTITATADGQTATATVYCTGGSTPDGQPSASGDAGSFTLNRDDFTLTIGDDDTFTMKATGVDSVIWSIADPTIATIDANGLVTAVSKGKTTITATAPDGSTRTCIVRVNGG